MTFKAFLQSVLIALMATVLFACSSGDNGSGNTPDETARAPSPIVTVQGENPITIAQGESYSDLGATATNNAGETIQVTVAGEVDTSRAGTYTLTYTAVDSDGNTTTTTRIINVLDETPPVITLLGENAVTVEQHADYVELGATAKDDDTDVEVVITGSVNTSEVGVYTVTYTATDSEGNVTEVSRTVTIVDTTPPVITLIGDNPVTVIQNTAYSEPGATAKDGDTNVDVVITGVVNASVAGVYTVTYTATDSAGNSSNTSRTVNVLDKTPPVITLNGDSSVDVAQNSIYTELGAAAKDGDTDVDVVITGAVDTSIVGVYTVTYTATDTASNSAIAKRLVTVSPALDTVKPVITILGDNPVSVIQNSIYSDAGASAEDAVDGIVQVIVESSVNTSEVGEYTVTYSATDAANNTSILERIVKIIPPKAALQISKFGEGAFTLAHSGSETLDCSDPRNCTASFEQGTSVTIVAEAGSNWSFNRWRDCDVTDGINCTITMTTDRAIFASFASSEPLVEKDNVVVLTENQIKGVSSFDSDNGTIVFDSSIDLSSLTVGDIIISKGIYLGDNDPNNIETYFAQRVNKIVSLTGAPTIVNSSPAALDDIIESGSVNINEQLTASRIASNSSSGGSDFTVNREATAVAGRGITVLDVNLVVYDKDGDFNTTNDQVSITGKTELSFDTDLDLNFSFGLKELRLISHVNMNSDLKVKVGPSVKIKEKRKEFNLPIKPILVTAGPLVFLFDNRLYFEASVDISAKMHPTVTLDASINAGAHWLKDHGFREVNSFTLDPSFSLSDSFTVEAKAEAGLRLETLASLYNIVGPVVSVTPYIGAKVFIPFDNDCFWDYDPYFGIKGGIGGEFKLFTRKMKFEMNLFDWTGHFGSGRADCSSADTEKPTTPSSLEIKNTTSNGLELTWIASEDDNNVKGYKLYRNQIQVEDSLVVNKYVETNLAQATEYCYQVSAVDSSGNESNLSETLCGTTLNIDINPPSSPAGITSESVSTSAIKLTWLDSVDDRKVQNYIIFHHLSDTDIHIIESTENSEITILGLTPSSNYCYSVAAVDSSGNISPSTEQSCTDTLDSELSVWTIFIGCQNREYLIEEKLDLDEESTSNISVSGIGQDYPGTNLSYSLTGYYNSETTDLSGKILWNFEGQSDERLDQFDATIGSGDSGDVNMEQVKVTGCDAKIRFVKNVNEEQNRVMNQAKPTVSDSALWQR